MIATAEDSELVIFDWSGYEAPEFHPGYAAKHGDSPTFTFFGDEDEAFEKIRAGFKTDLAHPCSQSVVKWREAGLLEPLDTSKIEGWKDLNPGIMAMKDLATTADGTAWFMPWDWGNTLLTYNSEKVAADDIKSLKSLADPKFKDRVSIGDNVDDAYALASLAIGLKDWTQMTDEQFSQASDFLREVHKNVRLYWTDTTEIVQAMSGGEVDLAWAWNDAAVQSALAGAPIKNTRDTAEGQSTWVCGYVRLKGAPGSADKAYDYPQCDQRARGGELPALRLGLWPCGRQVDGGDRPRGRRGAGLCRRREVRRQDAVPGAGARRAEAEDDRGIREDQSRVLSTLERTKGRPHG